MKGPSALAILLLAFGTIPLSAQPKMLEKAVTVLERTEFRIERGNCLVIWKPIYCLFPGTGYRLDAVGGSKDGAHVPQRYTITLNGGVELSWPSYGVKGPAREKDVCLVGRNFLRVTLHGAPGDRIFLGIHAEPGQVDLHRFRGGVPMIHSVSPVRLAATAGAQPAPAVTLTADRQAIAIGQEARLSWDAQNSRSVEFPAGDLGAVGTSGSARVWPEKDTVFRIEASSGGEKAGAETTVKVAVADPELELRIDPQTVYKGEEATLAWKTRNARLVRFTDDVTSSLPLSGSMQVRPDRFRAFELQAENGEKLVRRSAEAKVLDREEEERRAAEEKARRTIPPEIDRKLQATWEGLRAALRGGDAEKAVGFYCLEERGKARELYSALKNDLPAIGAEMRGIEFIEFLGDGAKYRTRRKETIRGKEYDITYYVYFVRDSDGQWRIYQF